MITAVLPVKSNPVTACRAVDLEPRIGAMVTQDSEDAMLMPAVICSIQELRQDNSIDLFDCFACGVGKPLHVQHVIINQ